MLPQTGNIDAKTVYHCKTLQKCAANEKTAIRPQLYFLFNFYNFVSNSLSVVSFAVNNY